MNSHVLLLTAVFGVAFFVLCEAMDSQESIQLEGKTKQTIPSYDDDISDSAEDALLPEEGKRATHIFRYGRAPVFRYGKRAAPAVFRYGKKATVFRYGKRDPELTEVPTLYVPVDESTLERMVDTEYGADYHSADKRKIFRYGKRSV